MYIKVTGESVKALISQMQDLTSSRAFTVLGLPPVDARISHSDVDHLMVYTPSLPIYGLEDLGFVTEVKRLISSGSKIPQAVRCR